MRRVLLGGLVGAGLVAAALAPQADPAVPEAAYRPVSSAVLACPELTGAGQAINVLGAVVAGPAEGPGSAVLRPMAATGDLVRLAGPGEPVALRSVRALAATDPDAGRRLVGAVGASPGSWRRQLEGTSEGLSSVALRAPGTAVVVRGCRVPARAAGPPSW